MPWDKNMIAKLNEALEPVARASWERNNPGIPWDITMEEAKRCVIVNGRSQLHPEDAAARARKAAA